MNKTNFAAETPENWMIIRLVEGRWLAALEMIGYAGYLPFVRVKGRSGGRKVR